MIDESLIKEMYVGGDTVLTICKKLYGHERSHIHSVYKVLKDSGLYVRDNNRVFRRKYDLDENFFDRIDTEAKAYILGFICADGYVSESDNRIVIALNSRDKDILERILLEVGSTSTPSEVIKEGGFIHTKISLCSKKLVSEVVKKGLHQGKSLTMTGEVINHVPEALVRHFLRGYFDGDGCMTLGVRYSSGVKYLIQIVGTLVFLQETFCKYFPTTCKIHAYKSCNMHCYKLSSKANVLRFLDYLYADSTISLNRKHATYCAHVKPRELLEPLNGNQQPSRSNTEGPETIERVATAITE